MLAGSDGPSPRARGSREPLSVKWVYYGFIPARAGNRDSLVSSVQASWFIPRVRGSLVVALGGAT